MLVDDCDDVEIATVGQKLLDAEDKGADEEQVRQELSSVERTVCVENVCRILPGDNLVNRQLQECCTVPQVVDTSDGPILISDYGHVHEGVMEGFRKSGALRVYSTTGEYLGDYRCMDNDKLMELEGKALKVISAYTRMYYGSDSMTGVWAWPLTDCKYGVAIAIHKLAVLETPEELMSDVDPFPVEASWYPDYIGDYDDDDVGGG
jgi:hypothetical protein